MIVPTITFDTSKHCACETPRPATFTDRCLTCGGMLAGPGHLFELPEAKAADTRKVGCDRPDGTMNVHLESETCEVCSEVKASDERLTWSLDALAFIMSQTFTRPTVEFERTELVRRAKELGLLGEERP